MATRRRSDSARAGLKASALAVQGAGVQSRTALAMAPSWDDRDRADAVGQLATLRDWLRFAVSRFEGSDVMFGHGTDRAVDEAAFLILGALRLPIADINPWLDARITTAEAGLLYDLIKARVTTRTPAPYLLGRADIQGVPFFVDERVIVPRSFIGELLGDGLEPMVLEPDAVESVLDLCTGSGCLAILAAMAFPNARVDASDVSSDALDVARINVDRHGLADRITLFPGDLFAGLPEGRCYDLILSNPPYVRAEAVQVFPPEYAAEPALAHDGGVDGLDLVHRILHDCGRFLQDDGLIVVEIGQERDVLEAVYPDLPFLWLDTEASEGEVFALHAEDLEALEEREA